MGVAPLLQFDDGDQLLGAIVGDRYRRGPASGYLLDGGLDVIGVVIAPVHDQQVLDAAHDEQLAVGDEANVSGSEPRLFGCARRRSDKPGTERALSLLRFPPI